MTKDAFVKHLITLIQVLGSSSHCTEPTGPRHPSSLLSPRRLNSSHTFCLFLPIGRTAHSTTSNNILHIIDLPERHTRGVSGRDHPAVLWCKNSITESLVTAIMKSRELIWNWILKVIIAWPTFEEDAVHPVACFVGRYDFRHTSTHKIK